MSTGKKQKVRMMMDNDDGDDRDNESVAASVAR
jgi:hypothetical protein